MVSSIILIVASLVILNFLLLAFSCNKTVKKGVSEVKPIQKHTVLTTNQLDAHELAPTGS